MPLTESLGRQNRPHRNAAGLVEVGRDGDPHHLRGVVEVFRCRGGEPIHGLPQIEHGRQFVHGGRFERHIRIGEQRRLDAVPVFDTQTVLVEAAQSGIVMHVGSSACRRRSGPMVIGPGLIRLSCPRTRGSSYGLTGRRHATSTMEAAASLPYITSCSLNAAPTFMLS